MAVTTKKDAPATTSKTKENKIKKLQKHVKKFPKDEAAKTQLQRLQSGDYQPTPRKRPVSKNGWVNSMLNPKLVPSVKLETLKKKLRPEKRKFELMETAKQLKVESKI